MDLVIRDEVGLYWLYRKFDEHAGLIPFPDEACKVLRRLIDDKEIHSFTFTPATSARRLVEHWLDTGRLPMRHRGKVIDEQLSGVPVGDELSDYVDLNDSLDGKTIIRCSDLIRLMLAERMTVPNFLLADGSVMPLKADDAEYKRAWELWSERDTWASMQHQNDPDKFEKIRANLARIDMELKKLSLPEDAVNEAAPVKGRSLTKEEVMRAFGNIVTKDTTLQAALENGRAWVLPARVEKGDRGRGRPSSKWDPVLLAVALHEKRMATKTRLNHAFFQHSFLSPWREEWHEQSEGLHL